MAISPDPLPDLKKYTQQKGISFQLLSDADLTVIREWGIVNPKSPKLPHPTAVIVDRDGIIRYFRQDVDYRHRPPASELLAALDRLPDPESSPPSSG